MDDIKNCKCKTNAVILRNVDGEETVSCLRCKVPYLLKFKSYTVRMPLTVNLDGSCNSEIILNGVYRK